MNGLMYLPKADAPPKRDTGQREKVKTEVFILFNGDRGTL